MNTYPKPMAAALMMLALIVPIQAATHFYVSPTPTSNGNGLTPSTPFNSLVNARNAVRTYLANNSLTDHVIVNLLPGEYPFTQPLDLTSADSGENGYQVIWQAYDNANRPVFNGGQTLTGWVSDGTDKLRHTTAIDRTAATKIRNLWVNGERLPWPVKSSAVIGTGWHSTGSVRDGIVVPSSALPATTVNPTAIELSWRIDWRHHRVPVTGIQSQNNTTIINMPSYALSLADQATTASPRLWPRPADPSNTANRRDFPFTLENVWESRTQGTWYHSLQSKWLYIMTTETAQQLTAKKVVIPALNGPFIKVAGFSPTNRVKNLTFKGIIFRYSGLQFANTKGVLNVQAGKWMDSAESIITNASYGYLPEGAIQVSNATNLSVDQNVFEHLGTAGVVFQSAVSNSEIVRNTFSDISDTAISLGHWKLDNINTTEGAVSGIVVNKNLIRKVGVEYNGAPGITGYFLQDCTISQNDLKDLPYSGIAVGWGWATPMDLTSNPAPGTINNPSARNKIINNKIDTYMTKVIDGGGIYVLGMQPDQTNGSRIDGNYLIDMTGKWGAIYPDNGSNWWTITNNVIEDVSDNWLFIWKDDIQNITVDYSWTTTSALRNDGVACNIYNTTVAGGTSWPPSGAVPIIDRSGLNLVNRALGATATRSSIYGTSGSYEAGKANDDSISTIWSADDPLISPQSRTEWWSVDLGQAYPLERIEVVSRQTDPNDVTRANLEVWVSNDPNFSTKKVLGVVNSSRQYKYRGDSYTFNHTETWPIDALTDIPYRFVRVTKSVPNQYLTLAEVRVWGPRLERLTGAATALNSWTNPLLPPENALDGNANTIWSAAAEAPGRIDYWTVDFGAPKRVHSIEITARAPINGIEQPSPLNDLNMWASNDSSFTTKVLLGSVNATQNFVYRGATYTYNRATPWKIDVSTEIPYRYIRLEKATAGEYLTAAEINITGW